jgi:hypothetical protein
MITVTLLSDPVVVTARPLRIDLSIQFRPPPFYPENPPQPTQDIVLRCYRWGAEQIAHLVTGDTLDCTFRVFGWPEEVGAYRTRYELTKIFGMSRPAPAP